MSQMVTTKGHEVKRNEIFAVYDEKAKAYGPPLTHPTTDVAVRSFTAACQNEESFLSKFPSDYALYRIGYYDEVSACIEPFAEPQYVIRASEIVSMLRQQAKGPEVINVSDNGRA
jgi:hypothetical protein